MNLSISRQWLFGAAFPFILIVLPVFVDMSYGALGGQARAGLFTVGVLFRGSVAALGLYLVLRSRAAPLKALLSAFFVIFLVSNITWATTSDAYSFAHEISQGMKVAFPWLLAGILLFLHQRAPIDPFYVLSLLAWAGFLSAASLLGAMALGIGQDTYGAWSYGTKGVFNAQNDIGLTLILTLVAAVVVLSRTRRIRHLVMTAAIACAGLVLGTRTGVLGPLLIVGALILAAIPNPRLFSPTERRRDWRAAVILILPVTVAALVALAIFSQGHKTEYLMKRIESLSEHTPRSKLEAAGIERLTERGFVPTLLGDGGLAFKKHVAENLGKGRRKVDPGAMAAPGESKKLAFPVHRVENDLIDVLGFYGVLQFAVIYGGLAFVFVVALGRAVRAWNLENVALLLILTLFLAHSSLAGHGIFSAQVGTVLAPVIFLQLRGLRWRRRGESAAQAPTGPVGAVESTGR